MSTKKTLWYTNRKVKYLIFKYKNKKKMVNKNEKKTIDIIGSYNFIWM